MAKIMEGSKSSADDKANDNLTVESLLERLGGFSWFQFWALIIIVSPELSAAMISLSPVLTGSHHLYWNDYKIFNLSQYENSSDKISYPYPGSLQTVLQEWDLVEGKAWISPLFISFQLFGALFGSLLAGQFAERYGRKTAHFGMCFLMGLFSFTAGWAPDPFTFCALRFLSGFSVGGCFVVYLNYLMEFLTPSYRTLCGCVSLWAVGEMVLALVGYFCQSWRQILWVSSLPAFLVLLAYPWLPESPRWLLCQGRTAEALEVFDQIAKFNGKPPVNPSELKIIQREILEAKRGENDKPSSVFSGFKVFSHPEYRYQLLVLAFSWFASQLIYYGISYNIKNLDGDPYRNIFYMGIVSLPGSFTGLLTNNRLGRRTTIIGFTTVTFFLLIAMITAMEINVSEDQRYSVVLFLSLGVRLFVSAGFAVLSCFTAESFPTVVRVGCMGICGVFGCLGGILAPQFVFLSTIVHSAQYITFGLLSLCAIVGAFNLKEMTGEPLEDCFKQNEIRRFSLALEPHPHTKL